MKSIVSFVRTTIIGGIVFLLPVVMLVIVVGKSFNIVKSMSQPLADLFEADKVIGYAVLDIVAAVILLTVAFLAGALARKPKLQGVYKKIDTLILQIVPGYSWLKGMTGNLSDAEAEKFLKPVAVMQGDMFQLGFESERLDNDWVVVFLPDAPDAHSGSIAFFKSDTVVPLKTGFGDITGCMKKLGHGASKLAPTLNNA